MPPAARWCASRLARASISARAALVAGHEVLAIAEVVDGVLEQIGQVEFQNLPLRRTGC